MRWMLFCGLLIATMSAHALMLNVVDGQLAGASGVRVGDTLYEVEFVDGSCIELFGGCDNATDDFAFTTSDDALVALEALAAQVIVDVGAGDFDSDPSLTTGCSFSGLCELHVPFGVTFVTPSFDFANTAVFLNSNDVDVALISEINRSFSTDGQLSLVFVRFSDPSPVPIPAALPLFLSGLAGLGVMRRRKRKVQRAGNAGDAATRLI